ncbi:uncharacterized protein RCC_05255 [Ramularia collo-cygni]|uniref:Uncharacterized protein n=1 Tax=Ramularia collo-cygni TaxID=112498 RepID=A0A2D3V9V0_9PEZI|nr:uncharacterized protein RCC_05255 [Ramularia collo-cygni]CZT19404.1 uncharacterized protein RCC_05255 [Ramularia collo-cygni]
MPKTPATDERSPKTPTNLRSSTPIKDKPVGALTHSSTASSSSSRKQEQDDSTNVKDPKNPDTKASKPDEGIDASNSKNNQDPLATNKEDDIGRLDFQTPVKSPPSWGKKKPAADTTHGNK